MQSPVSPPHPVSRWTPGDSGAHAGGAGTSAARDAVVQRHPEHPELGLPPVHALGRLRFFNPEQP